VRKGSGKDGVPVALWGCGIGQAVANTGVEISGGIVEGCEVGE